MKRLRFLIAAVALSIVGQPYWAFAAPIDELTAAAKKERAIEFYAPSTLTPQGAQALGEAFNKKYGLDISLKYSPSGNMRPTLQRWSAWRPRGYRLTGT